MKHSKTSRETDRLVITETASGEVFVKELESQLWWRIPTEKAPVDMKRLQHDCAAICNGAKKTPYLQYIGRYDTSDVLLSDARYARFVGEYPLGKYDPITSQIQILAWHPPLIWRLH